MSAKSYSELLKSPHWQRKRLEILQLANFACEECEETDKALHVHHKAYKRGVKPWEYEANELQCLCEDCHSIATEKIKRFDSLCFLIKMGEDSRSIDWLNGAMEMMFSTDGPGRVAKLNNAEEVDGAVTAGHYFIGNPLGYQFKEFRAMVEALAKANNWEVSFTEIESKK